MLPSAPAAVNLYPAILLDICRSLSAIVLYGYLSIRGESLDVAWQHCQYAKQDWAQLWVCVKMSPGGLVLLWLLQARVTEPRVCSILNNSLNWPGSKDFWCFKRLEGWTVIWFYCIANSFSFRDIQIMGPWFTTKLASKKIINYFVATRFKSACYADIPLLFFTKLKRK